MLPVLWSREAIDDLAQIVDYIEQRNLLAATELHREIKQAAERLGSMPFLYRHGRVRGTRELVVHPNYLVIYQVNKTSVDVLRVLHARQNYPQ